MTEDDQDLLERIEALVANAWDDDEHETLVEARERIKDLSAEKDKLQAQYDEMGNAMLKHTGKAAEEIVRLELENDGLKAENERLTYNGIHSCHDQCERPLCVVERENKKLREAIENAVQEIDEGWSLNARDILEAALGEKK